MPGGPLQGTGLPSPVTPEGEPLAPWDGRWGLGGTSFWGKMGWDQAFSLCMCTCVSVCKRVCTCISEWAHMCLCACACALCPVSLGTLVLSPAPPSGHAHPCTSDLDVLPDLWAAERSLILDPVSKILTPSACWIISRVMKPSAAASGWSTQPGEEVRGSRAGGRAQLPREAVPSSEGAALVAMARVVPLPPRNPCGSQGEWQDGRRSTGSTWGGHGRAGATTSVCGPLRACLGP